MADCYKQNDDIITSTIEKLGLEVLKKQEVSFLKPMASNMQISNVARNWIMPAKTLTTSKRFLATTATSNDTNRNKVRSKTIPLASLSPKPSYLILALIPVIHNKCTSTSIFLATHSSFSGGWYFKSLPLLPGLSSTFASQFFIFSPAIPLTSFPVFLANNFNSENS